MTSQRKEWGNMKHLFSGQPLFWQYGIAIFVGDQIVVSFTEGIADFANDSAKRFCIVVTEKEAHRVKGVAQYPGHGL